jgi:hypothetical protein
MRAESYSTLDELGAHYTGGDDPMSPLNYVWYQYRWQRLAARMFDADGERTDWSAFGIAFMQPIDSTPARSQRRRWHRC